MDKLDNEELQKCVDNAYYRMIRELRLNANDRINMNYPSIKYKYESCLKIEIDMYLSNRNTNIYFDI